MYYFEILDILETVTEKEALSSYEIYLRLAKTNSKVSKKRVNDVLTSIYLKVGKVDRNERNIEHGKEYIYFCR